MTPYKHEAEDELQAYGKYNPASCNDHSKVPIGGAGAVVANDFAPDSAGFDTNAPVNQEE